MRPWTGRVLGLIGVIGLAVSLSGCVGLDGPMPSLIGMDESAARPPSVEQVFVVSTRKAEGGADQVKASVDGAHYALATMTVPAGHKPGALELPVFGAAKPLDHIALRSNRELDAEEF